ncbi:MAG: lysine--tRNA ligase, partial [Firmicutes bacterium]|nr:lysine--tRNA ligase [Bacillota bacterium]
MDPVSQNPIAEPLNEQQLSEQEGIRREKLNKLIEAGQSPYAITHFSVSHTSRDILDQFDALDGKPASLAGRLMGKRVMGKASFGNILDADGQLQIYVRRDDIGADEYMTFKAFDIGDVVGVTGTVFRTQKGEISLHVQTITLLSKSLKVLPEKYHGLKDPDLRYRQRYVDMIVNPEVRDTFRKRTQVIKAVREFLDARGFLEVDTPVLQTIEIGAAARTFKTHLNALDLDMFLRIETELYLK